MDKVTDIKVLSESVNAPLNIMSLPTLTDLNVVAGLGVKRFSLGNALSDLTISFIEQVSRGILTSNNTEQLYTGNKITTVFNTDSAYTIDS